MGSRWRVADLAGGGGAELLQVLQEAVEGGAREHAAVPALVQRQQPPQVARLRIGEDLLVSEDEDRRRGAARPEGGNLQCATVQNAACSSTVVTRWMLALSASVKASTV